jgi:uncharacterized membrane protein
MIKNPKIVIVLTICMSFYTFILIVTGACLPASAQNATTGANTGLNYLFVEKWGSLGTGPGQ